MTTNEQLIEALDDHGFRHERRDDGVLVALVPWVDSRTGATGVDREPVRDMRECAVVLGY